MLCGVRTDDGRWLSFLDSGGVLGAKPFHTAGQVSPISQAASTSIHHEHCAA